jgi:Helix-turn-helix domain
MNHTFGQLPTVVRHDHKVSDFQCRMYAEIQSLSNKYNYCFASNDYLAKIFSKTPETISRAISGLQKLGYLTVIIEDGYKRKMKVKTDFSDMEPLDENVKGGSQKDQGGLAKRSRGVGEKIKAANNIIQLDKSNEINRSSDVETSSTLFLDENEIEDIEQQIYASKATQKKERKNVAPKKKESANPAPIKAMFEIYEDYYSLMIGEKPIWQDKYAPALKKLHDILTARCAQKGVIQLDPLQPWKDFVGMWAKYLYSHPKEIWHRDNFNPMTIYSQFNGIIAKLNAQPVKVQSDRMDKWEKWGRENGVM